MNVLERAFPGWETTEDASDLMLNMQPNIGPPGSWGHGIQTNDIALALAAFPDLYQYPEGD